MAWGNSLQISIFIIRLISIKLVHGIVITIFIEDIDDLLTPYKHMAWGNSLHISIFIIRLISIRLVHGIAITILIDEIDDLRTL